MQKLREGIDPEVKLPESKSIHVPLDKAAVSEKQVSHAWDELADKWISGYTEYGDMNREYVIDPVIFRLLGSINGLSILDAGCGGGYLCRQLARKGAKVVGVDISKKFIEIAEQKEKENPLNIKYYAGSLHNLPMFKDKTFDIIISNLVLMDVADLNKAIKELRRVLKKSGKLIFSIMHPCFPSPTIHGWMREPRDSDRKEDRLYWMVDRYFDRTMETWQFYDWPAAYSFHRPLSDYMKVLLKNGLIITDFEEPTPSKKAIREHYREFGDEYDRIPWFLIIGAKKE
jgi:ubiquinone biosynthesis O-methyltransferase